MKKSKSLSLSEKDRNKIINIIHSKITPLKFKYVRFFLIQKKFQNERQFLLNASLPKLKNQNQKDLDHINKRISISTYIEKNCRKSKNQKEKPESQFRKQVLDTQNLKNQHQFLTKQLNYSCHNFHKNNLRASSTFQKYGDPFPIQKNQKILSDFLLLQKKKKLKNIKSEISLKKNKLFNEIQNQQREKRQEETLHKKFQQNSRQILKQKFSHKKINSQLSSISSNFDQNKMSRIPRNTIQMTIQNLQSLKREKEEKNDLFVIYKQQEKKITQNCKQMNYQNQNKIKDYLRFFKKTDPQKRPQSSNNQSYQSNKVEKNDLLKTNDKILLYKITQNEEQQSYTPLYCYPDNLSPIFYAKEKQNQRGIYRMLDQKDKNTIEQNDYLDHQIKNAKMRIKFNHRKIVNLGKIQKFSGFGANNGFDGSSMS